MQRLGTIWNILRVIYEMQRKNGDVNGLLAVLAFSSTHRYKVMARYCVITNGNYD